MLNDKDSRPIKHKLLSDAGYFPIKNNIRSYVLSIRYGTNIKPDEEAIKAAEKKKKFLRFILNLSSKQAFRKWKTEVFGLGGDPRLALLLITERDKVRQEFFHPQIQRRKNLRFLKKLVTKKNHCIADEIKNSLISLKRSSIIML